MPSARIPTTAPDVQDRTTPPAGDVVQTIATRPYLALAGAPARLRETLRIHATSRTFVPRPEEIAADWVATIATPAFKLLRHRHGPIGAFASIGTGAGLDALAAIETLGVSRVGITDVHEEVVAAARENIRANLAVPGSVEIESGTGDLLEPLSGGPRGYDLIYENLPHLPVADAATLASGRASSGHALPRPERIPGIFLRNLLALHYATLLQAKAFLAPGGRVLSMLGTRAPLGVCHELSLQTQFRPGILTYGWKLQAEPEEMLSGHLAMQRDGLGPFYFYPAGFLQNAFRAHTPGEAAARAFEIEQALAPHRLDAAAALEQHRKGTAIGHTTAALLSTLP